MASISSTNSSSSLGNTSLRGFGGMASGIDRDSIIEQMTLGTTTKINNQKRKLTQLQWKQEAYRGISDSIIDLTDKYASYSSSTNLKDASAFAKNIISIHGKESSTSFVTAKGSSSLINNVSLTGVKQLATSTVLRSDKHINPDGMKTTLNDLTEVWSSSNLEGKQLKFGVWQEAEGGKFTDGRTFTFKSTYKDGDETKPIDYTVKDGDYEKFVDDLNKMVKDQGFDDVFKFTYDDASGQIGISKADKPNDKPYVIQGNSTALKALGYVAGDDGHGKDGISFTADNNEFNAHVEKKLEETAINTPTALEYLTGKKLTFNYDGNKKEIELITASEKAELQNMIDNNASSEDIMKAVQKNLQGRLDRAFGENAVTAELIEGTKKGENPGDPATTTWNLSFKTTLDTSTVSVISNDYGLLSNLGLSYGSSNKVNLEGKLNQFDWYDENKLELEINGVKIDGITKDSTVNDILSKINASKAGVKATYVDATGEFMLVSSETGSGRKIELNGELAENLFGGGSTVDGQNAKITVNYGDGVEVEMERASNTFNLEGLTVTVSGVFGGSYEMAGKDAVFGTMDKEGYALNDKGERYTDPITGKYVMAADVKDVTHTYGTKDKDGYALDKNGERIWQKDTSAAVTFSAKADVDGAVEKVKAFFEDFNKLVTEINGQITTRPDSNYQPLTDEQKEQMDETSIENWEKKAKQGMLYGDAAMRDLSMDVQSIFTKMMNNGATYEDLKEIGITYSEDYLDGGTLVFDEAAFRTAMENNPDKVANIFAGGGDVSKGLINVVEETFNPYATRYANRNGGSYGRLIEIAGSDKKPTTLMNNQIYKQLKEMQETIDRLQEQLMVEQDRYISQFTTMETLLNQMNTQSSYLSQLTG